jgi:hypothetical protein
MLIDSNIIESSPAHPPVSAVPDSEPSPMPVPPPQKARAAASQERWHAGLAMSTQLEAGRLPKTPIGLGFSLVSQSPRWLLALRANSYPEVEARGGGGQTRLSWSSFGATGCASLVLRLRLCGGLELGLVTAIGRGFLENRNQREWTFDALAGPRLDVARGRIFGWLGLWSRLALLRPEFGYEDENGQFQVLYAPRAFALSGEIGLGVHFL